MIFDKLAEFAKFTRARGLLALRYAVPICVVLAILFNLFPQMDLWGSTLFFSIKNLEIPSQPSGFGLGQHVFLQWVYHQVNLLSRIALLLSTLVFVVLAVKRNAKAFYAAVVLLSLLAGPMYAVNAGVKEHWGRARPRELVQFEGTKQFTPAWVISSQCSHNCAFTSGHAAAGFALCIGFFVSRRKIWLNGGLLLGGFIGLTRMMNGAHFLSDIVFSFFIVFIASALVAFLFSVVTLKLALKLEPKLDAEKNSVSL